MAEQKEGKAKSEGKGKPIEKPKFSAKDAQEGIRAIVRISGSDVEGGKRIEEALRNVKGVSHSMAHALRTVSGYNEKQKIGSLSKEELLKIEGMIKDPVKYGVPIWMVNRRKDLVTGENKHISSSDWEMALNTDIRRLVEIKTTRGLRLSWGLPVRGQRTKSGYTHPPRRMKRRGNVVGVSKKKMMPAQAAAEAAKEKGSEKK